MRGINGKWLTIALSCAAETNKNSYKNNLKIIMFCGFCFVLCLNLVFMSFANEPPSY